MPPPSPVCAVIEIVKADPSQAAILALLRKTVWLQTYRGIYPDEKLDGYDLEYYTARDRGRMERPDNFYYFFMDGDRPVGYFSFGPYHYGSYKDFVVCINNLYILEGYKGLGLGRRAIEMVRAYCRRQKIGKFFCGCNANNLPAVAFYGHMGGVVGSEALKDVPAEDQIIHFEFYLGDTL